MFSVTWMGLWKLTRLSASCTPWLHAGIFSILGIYQPSLHPQVYCSDFEWGWLKTQQRLQSADLTNEGKITSDTLRVTPAAASKGGESQGDVWKAELSWGVCTSQIVGLYEQIDFHK